MSLSQQYPRKRSRSRSPTNGVKLHVKNLPLQTSQEALHKIFEAYGIIDEIRIIRKGSNGQPLRECVYGFVVMETFEAASRAMEDLNSKG